MRWSLRLIFTLILLGLLAVASRGSDERALPALKDLKHSFEKGGLYSSGIEATLNSLQTLTSWPPGYEQLLSEFLMQPKGDHYVLSVARALSSRPASFKDPELKRLILTEILMDQLDPREPGKFLFLTSVHEQGFRDTLSSLLKEDPLLIQWLTSNFDQLQAGNSLQESVRKAVAGRWVKKLPLLALKERQPFVYQSLLRSIQNLKLDGEEFDRMIAQRLSEKNENGLITLSKLLRLLGDTISL